MEAITTSTLGKPVFFSVCIISFIIILEPEFRHWSQLRINYSGYYILRNFTLADLDSNSSTTTQIILQRTTVRIHSTWWVVLYVLSNFSTALHAIALIFVLQLRHIVNKLPSKTQLNWLKINVTWVAPCITNSIYTYFFSVFNIEQIYILFEEDPHNTVAHGPTFVNPFLSMMEPPPLQRVHLYLY